MKQELFDYMYNEHGIILLDTEMEDIIRIVLTLAK